MLRSSLLTVVLACSICGPATADDWTQWRGPTGNGVAPGANPPAVWGAEQLRWKVAVPGSGHATPIIKGDRIYLMTAVKTEPAAKPAAGDDAPGAGAAQPPPGRGGRGGARGQSAPAPTEVFEFRVLALDRADGSTVWSTTVRKEVPHEGIHSTGSFAGGSPVVHGGKLYAFFGSRGMYCLDLAGNVKWETDLGDMQTRRQFGEGASCAVHADTVVVPWDHEGDSFVAALDAATGTEKWRRPRDESTTWTTPVIVEVRGEAQAVVAGTTASVSYDLQTGREMWRCGGLTTNVIPTPVVGHGMIYLTSGFRGAALQAVKLDEAEGDITGTPAIAWERDRGTPYVPSPLLSGTRLYFLRSNNGIISCVDALTGTPHYDGERLELGNVYASPVAAGGRVYVCDREGQVVVLEDGPALKVIATNSLGEGIDASPAIVGEEIFVRGSDHLFCFAQPKKAAAAGAAP